MTTLAARRDVITPDPEVVEQARSLRPLVESEADACESLGTMPEKVVKALRDTGLFYLMVPRELGGTEVSAVTALSVFEELTAADASIGWSHMANASSSAFSAYLGDDAVAEMFKDHPAIMAGQFSPKAPSSLVDGGYKVSGRYSFGSGSGHADWIGGGSIEMDGDGLKMVNGKPIIRAYFVPRSEVEFLGNWDVMGLVGTGSYDYAVSERVVPEAFTFNITDPTQYRGGALYGLGVMGMTSIGHAGFSLGVSRRAIDEVVRLSATKQRLGRSTPVAGIERFQYELGRHSAMLKAARAFLFEAFSDAEGTVTDGRDLTATQSLTIRQATTHVTHVSSAVVDFAYHWSGADGIREGVMQRLWRDTHTSTQHIFVDDNTFTDAGVNLLSEAGSLPA